MSICELVEANIEFLIINQATPDEVKPLYKALPHLSEFNNNGLMARLCYKLLTFYSENALGHASIVRNTKYSLIFDWLEYLSNSNEFLEMNDAKYKKEMSEIIKEINTRRPTVRRSYIDFDKRIERLRKIYGCEVKKNDEVEYVPLNKFWNLFKIKTKYSDERMLLHLRKLKYIKSIRGQGYLIEKGREQDALKYLLECRKYNENENAKFKRFRTN